jgi:hypothetical protein
MGGVWCRLMVQGERRRIAPECSSRPRHRMWGREGVLRQKSCYRCRRERFNEFRDATGGAGLGDRRKITDRQRPVNDLVSIAFSRGGRWVFRVLAALLAPDLHRGSIPLRRPPVQAGLPRRFGFGDVFGSAALRGSRCVMTAPCDAGADEESVEVFGDAARARRHSKPGRFKGK